MQVFYASSGESCYLRMGDSRSWADVATTPGITTPIIQHKRSACVSLKAAKMEETIAKEIKRQMNISIHAVVQTNNTAPFKYHITFDNEQQYHTALPQKLQIQNNSTILYPLAGTRLRISVMRVDPEIEDTILDNHFKMFGKIISSSQKQFRHIQGVGQVHTGTRLLMIELPDPTKLPPDSIRLGSTWPNLVFYTIPGTNKRNQKAAFEARQAKREANQRAAEAAASSDKAPSNDAAPSADITDASATDSGSEFLTGDDAKSDDAASVAETGANISTTPPDVTSADTAMDGESPNSQKSDTTINKAGSNSIETTAEEAISNIPRVPPTEQSSQEAGASIQLDAKIDSPDNPVTDSDNELNNSSVNNTKQPTIIESEPPASQTIIDAISNEGRGHNSRLIDAPRINPYNRLKKKDLEQASIIVSGQEPPNERCSHCALDLSPAVNHDSCILITDSDDAKSGEALREDRQCRYGGDALIDAILNNRESVEKACERLAYILEHVHPVYWALESVNLLI